jgi:hypothetical protein
MTTQHILFICGSIERGKDGVGDYTRLLAMELARKGINCSIIALCDAYTECVEYGELRVGDISLPTLRLPQNISYKTCLKAACQFCIHAKPNWISVQFVPYSFDKRGLPFGFPGLVRSIYKSSIAAASDQGVCLHIMFHEIGIGIVDKAKIRQQIVGFLQKIIRVRLASIVKNPFINTNCDFYRRLLLKEGLTASILPLFGNIGMEETLVSFHDFLGIDSFITNQDECITLVTFGRIHSVFPFNCFFEYLKKLSSISGKQFRLVRAGNAVSNHDLYQEWTLLAANSSFLRLYSLPIISDGELRALFRSANAGITLSWLEGWQKSGAIAAMIESGLEVYGYFGNLRADYPRSSLPPHPMVVDIDDNPMRLLNATKIEPSSLVPGVAEQLIGQLALHERD